MVKWLRRSLPPSVQAPTGQQRDQDFTPPERSFWRILFGMGSDRKIYTIDAADAKRLRPVILRDPRAVRNEEIAAEAQRRRAAREDPLPITVIPNGVTEFELELPPATVLPPVPRPTPDWVETDVIEPPRRGGGDGGQDK
jgi:hypothetical protein